jgi:putative transposase
MRKPRQLREGARYHVSARANRKEMIFEPNQVKDLFLSTVKRAKKKYDFRIENFCIMGNHFHFLIQPGKGTSLSSILQWILSVFAMSYNRQKGLTGHVWGDRFSSRIINTLAEYVQAFSYIDANTTKRYKVSCLGEWQYSALGHARMGCRDIIGDLWEWITILFPSHKLRISD